MDKRPSIETGVIFTVDCPVFKRRLLLHKVNWDAHKKAGKHKIEEKHLHEVVKPALSAPTENVEFFEETEPPFEHVVYITTPRMVPWGNYIKVAVKLFHDYGVIKLVYEIQDYSKRGIKKYVTCN